GYFVWPPQHSAITIGAGESIEVSLAMTPGAVISGQVRDAFGQPMTNINVDVLAVTYRAGFPTLRAIAGQATDDRGEYRVFWVPPGEYFIAASPRTPARNAKGPQHVKTFYPSASNAGSATRLRVKPGDEATGIDIAVRSEALARVSGQVTSMVTPPPAPPTAQ